MTLLGGASEATIHYPFYLGAFSLGSIDPVLDQWPSNLEPLWIQLILTPTIVGRGLIPEARWLFVAIESHTPPRGILGYPKRGIKERGLSPRASAAYKFQLTIPSPKLRRLKSIPQPHQCQHHFSPSYSTPKVSLKQFRRSHIAL